MLLQGDLTPLSPDQRLAYVKAVCKSLGVNALTNPFRYILFKEHDNAPNKLVLYATKDCAEQLRKIHRVSVIPGTKKTTVDEDYATTELAMRDGTGRTDVATGVLYLWRRSRDGKTSYRLKGQQLGDAIMKSETKAKRRGTLSICGLGMLDEMDLESVRVVGGVTPDGRIFHYPELPPPTDEEPVHGILDGEPLDHAHPAGSEKAKQAEETLRRVEEADKALKWKKEQEAKADANAAKPAKAKEPEKAPPAQPEGPGQPTLEANETSEGDFIVTGDVDQVLPMIQHYCTRKDDWWRCTPEKLREMAELQVKFSFRLKIINKSSPRTTAEKKAPAGRTSSKGTGGGTTPEPMLLSGSIERVTAGMTSKNAPTRQVKIDKAWHSCYVNTIFEFLDKGVGREIECYVDKRQQIVGLKRVGTTDFDTDGRTPVIQRKDQQPGGSLF